MRGCPKKSKFQRLIPQDSHIARLVIILNSHQLTIHGGTSQTIAHIRSRFWIPSRRKLVRKLIMNCFSCNRFNLKPVFPLMGDLPKTRVDPPIKAFEDMGLNFTGPFLCRKSPNSHAKFYQTLFFVCFASKTVHLELVQQHVLQPLEDSYLAEVDLKIFIVTMGKNLLVRRKK